MRNILKAGVSLFRDPMEERIAKFETHRRNETQARTREEAQTRRLAAAHLVTGNDPGASRAWTPTHSLDTTPVFDWVVIGGGPQGIHLACTLIATLGLGKDRVRIIDPNPKLMHMWRKRTGAAGMRRLRSPWEHHLGLRSNCLESFRAERSLPREELPQLSLFNDHCNWLTAQFGLNDCHIRGTVRNIDIVGANEVHLLVGNEIVRARKVLLALGPNKDKWPQWCNYVRKFVPHMVSHVYSDPRVPAGSHVAVVGNGLTAAQTAMNFYLQGNKVTIYAKREFVASAFDADDKWMLEDSALAEFRRAPEVEREQILKSGRRKGAVPAAYKDALDSLIAAGDMDIEYAENPAPTIWNKGIRLNDKMVDHIVVCTGFESSRPGGELVDNLIDEHDLPVRNGIPVLRDNLQWGDTPIYASGILAQLQLGIPAGNFRGARFAADRLREYVL